MAKSYSKLGALKLFVYTAFFLMVAMAEGCGSGYEVKESNGRTYAQRKSWWEKMFFGS